jgi:hypothetical protein
MVFVIPLRQGLGIAANENENRPIGLIMRIEKTPWALCPVPYAILDYSIIHDK